MPYEHLFSRTMARRIAILAVPLSLFSMHLSAATLRHDGVAAPPHDFDRARYTVEVPAAGTLFVDLTSVGSGTAEPFLRLLAAESRARVTSTPRAIEITTEGPTTLWLEVAGLEPGRSVSPFKLHTVFIDAGESATLQDVDPWDDDLDGKPKPPPPPPPSAGTGGLDVGLCPPAADDHPDNPRCATPLGRRGTAHGRLANEAGDDEDVFAFTLAEVGLVSARAEADLDVRLSLRDDQGTLLATAEGGNTPARLTRALPAGRYLLEVESRYGEEGSYALTLQELQP